MGWLKKIFKQVANVQDDLLGSVGLADTDIFTVERKKREDKANARRRQEQAENAAKAQAENLRVNMGVDLQTANVANVEAGGSAAMLDDANDLIKKRKTSGGPALSSTLGIRA